MNAIQWIVIVIVAAALGFAAARWTASSDAGGSSEAGESDKQEILYWVAPMDPNYRRDEPGKSPMGMDLVPVYADGSQGGSDAPGLKIDPAVINNIGVKTATVERVRLDRRIGTVGFITADANRIGHIHVRSEGWIENLIANNEGERVEAGDVVFEIYSPALVSAQEEYLQALRMNREEFLGAAYQRLLALGMHEEQIEDIRESRRTRQRFEVRSPQDGYIMELNVREGMYVVPGTTIMSLADLSGVWVDVDVFEQQIGWVETGQTAEMRLPFAPDRVWVGTVDYIYPTIRPRTRTARVRLAFDNPDLLLKPDMYAQIDIAVSAREGVLAIPREAVIRTGRQDRVILAKGEGRFRPAEVATGTEAGGQVEILDGLAEGERIVISSQFLIDSEASMDASLLRLLDEDPGGMDHSGHDMSGMDHSGHDMEGMDHSGHDMQGMDQPGHDMSRMDHSGHDMEGMDHSGHDMQGKDQPDHDMSRMDHSGHGMEGMDHSGHDMQGMDHSGHDPEKTGNDVDARPLPRTQGRPETADASLAPLPAGESRGGGAGATDDSRPEDQTHTANPNGLRA